MKQTTNLSAGARGFCLSASQLTTGAGGSTPDKSMKNGALKVWTTQVAQKIEEELKTETDTDRVCVLLDAREYLRRTWHVLDGSPFEPNDTGPETLRAIHGA